MRLILPLFLLMGMALAGAAGAGGAPEDDAAAASPEATVPGQVRQQESQGRQREDQVRQQESQGRQQPEGAAGGQQYAPGNTGQNRQHDTRLEADDQSNDQAAVELTRKIRRALTDDPSLSMNAHNVKIITTSGRVTLRGPVDSEAERRKVEAIAKQAAGSRPVVNELQVDQR